MTVDDFSGEPKFTHDPPPLMNEKTLISRDRLKGIKYRDLVLLRSIKEIKEASLKLNLPSEVIKEAIECLNKALDLGLTRDLGHICLKASCLYLAARLFNVPLTLDRVLANFKCCCKRPYRALLKLTRELKFKLQPLKPEALLTKVIYELNLPAELEDKAFQEIRRLKRVLRGKSPKTITAVAIVKAARELGLSLVERKVAETIGITPTTLRAAKKTLMDREKESYVETID